MRGFTVIEILVTVSILAILMVIIFLGYSSFRDRMSIDVISNEVVGSLHLARNKTVSSVDSSSYGVHFENNQYVLFKGNVYNPGDINNIVYTLPAQVEIYAINLSGGGGEVLFNRINGTTDSDGDITIRLISDPSRLIQINIFASGQISISGTVTPSGTRIVDSRHLHLDLGWSIQGATNLRLFFTDPSNPDVQEDVVMDDYFDVGQTVFNWIDSINVNGATQTLRLHTHQLDAVDTDLCIHRDGRYNNKALNVSIDGKDVVSYTASGTATVGMFGGILEVQ